MKAEHLNPFIKNTREVINLVTGVSVNTGRPFIKDSPVILYDIAIMLGMTGTLKGQVILSMSRDMAKALVSKMMMGMPIEDIGEMEKSALSELGNMIMGNSCTELAKIGVICDITPPTTMIGQSMNFSSSCKNISIPIETEFGEILMDLALKYE